MALLDNYSSTMASYTSLLHNNRLLQQAAGQHAAHVHTQAAADWSVEDVRVSSRVTPVHQREADDGACNSSGGSADDGMFRPYGQLESVPEGSTGSSPPMGQTDLRGGGGGRVPMDLKTSNGNKVKQIWTENASGFFG